MAVVTALIDDLTTELFLLEMEDTLLSPATKPQQKTLSANNPNRMALVECCNRTLVPSDALKVVLDFLFIYIRGRSLNIASS